MHSEVEAQPAARRKRRSPQEIMDRILNAAGDEFKRAGFAGATTAAIARTADVTEAQLFRYFASKADLFRDAIFKPLDRHFEDFNARHAEELATAANARELAESYIAELQEFVGDHSRMLMSFVVARTYAGGPHDVDDINSLNEYFDHGAAMMRSRLDADPRVDPRLMVRVSFAAVLGCVMFKDWIFPPGLASDREIGAAISDFVIDGINANGDFGPVPTANRREK